MGTPLKVTLVASLLRTIAGISLKICGTPLLRIPVRSVPAWNKSSLVSYMPVFRTSSRQVLELILRLDMAAEAAKSEKLGNGLVFTSSEWKTCSMGGQTINIQ